MMTRMETNMSNVMKAADFRDELREMQLEHAHLERLPVFHERLAEEPYEVPAGISLYVPFPAPNSQGEHMAPAQIVGNTLAVNSQPADMLRCVLVEFDRPEQEKDAKRLAWWLRGKGYLLAVAALNGESPFKAELGGEG